jgi:large subunit ribosomal protein L8e
VLTHSMRRDCHRYRKDKELFIAPEGLYTGQFIYCGEKAVLAVGNTLPVGNMPEGTVICNLEVGRVLSSRVGWSLGS